MLPTLFLFCLIGLQAGWGQESTPYHGLPIGSMFFTSDSTKGNLYAADPKTVIAVGFRHHGQVGCATFMAGPPKAAEGTDLTPEGEGLILPIRVKPVAEADLEGNRQKRGVPVGFPWNLNSGFGSFANLRVPQDGSFDQSSSNDPFRGINLEIGPEDPEWKGVTGSPSTPRPTTPSPVTRIHVPDVPKMKMMPISEIMKRRNGASPSARAPARIYPATTVLPAAPAPSRSAVVKEDEEVVIFKRGPRPSTRSPATRARATPRPYRTRAPTRRRPAPSRRTPAPRRRTSSRRTSPRSQFRSRNINPSRGSQQTRVTRFRFRGTPKGWTPTNAWTRRSRLSQRRTTPVPNRPRWIRPQRTGAPKAPKAPALRNPSTPSWRRNTTPRTVRTTTTERETTTTTEKTTTPTPTVPTTTTRRTTTERVTTTERPTTTTRRRTTTQAPRTEAPATIRVAIPRGPEPPVPAKKESRKPTKVKGGLNLIFFDAMPPAFKEKPNIGQGLVFVDNGENLHERAEPLNKAFWGPLPRYPELYEIHTEPPTTTEEPTTTEAPTTTEEPSTTTEEQIIRLGGLGRAPGFGAPGSGAPGTAGVIRNPQEIYEFGQLLPGAENDLLEEPITTKGPDGPSWWVVEDPRAKLRRPSPPAPSAQSEEVDGPTPLPKSFEITQDEASPPILPTPRDGETYVIPDAEDETLLIELPDPFKLTDFQWFGIYDHCRGTRTSYVSLEDLRPPQEAVVEGFEGWQYDTKSSDIVVMNCNTLLVRGFTFSGRNHTQAYFYVGVGDFPDAIQQHVQAEVVGQPRNEPLRDYKDEDVLIKLTDNWKTFDISFISVFSPEIRTSFGHADIPPVVVPPCEEFFE